MVRLKAKIVGQQILHHGKNRTAVLLWDVDGGIGFQWQGVVENNMMVVQNNNKQQQKKCRTFRQLWICFAAVLKKRLNWYVGHKLGQVEAACFWLPAAGEETSRFEDFRTSFGKWLQPLSFFNTQFQTNSFTVSQRVLLQLFHCNTSSSLFSVPRWSRLKSFVDFLPCLNNLVQPPPVFSEAKLW